MQRRVECSFSFSIGRFRYVDWVKCPNRVVDKASALRAGKRASG